MILQQQCFLVYMEPGPRNIVSSSSELLSTASVFKLTFKRRVPTRNFGGSVDVGVPAPSLVSHLFCWVRWPAFLGF